MNKFNSPMLARDFEPDKVVYPVFASPKIDGIRGVMDIFNGEYGAYSRSGKLLRNRFLQAVMSDMEFMGFDGEFVVGDYAAPDVYNKTQAIMAIEGEPDFTFWVFDHRMDGEDHAWEHRHHMLKQLVPAMHPRIKVLEQVAIHNLEQLEQYEADCLERGFEGIMIRRPKAGYKYGRSTVKEGNLLKVKRWVTKEYTVTGFNELMHNENESFKDELGRTKRSTDASGLVPTGMLGSFNGTSPDWPGFEFSPSAGTMTLAERKEAWDNRESLLGTVRRMEYLPHGGKDRPRHPFDAGPRDADDMS